MKNSFFDTPMMPRLITVIREMKAGRIVVEPIELKEENNSLYCEFLNSIINGYPIGDFVTWKFAGDQKNHVFGKDSPRLSFLFQVLYGDYNIHFDTEKCLFICEQNENTVPLKSFLNEYDGETILDYTISFHRRTRPDLARKAYAAINLIIDRLVIFHPAVTGDVEEVKEAVRLREKNWQF